MRIDEGYCLLEWGSAVYIVYYSEAVPYILKQIQMLWEPKTIRILYSDMTEYVESKEQQSSAADTKKSGL